ncbi:MAG: PilZ domain-containing protein [Acidobacteriaceae bacterium]
MYSFTYRHPRFMVDLPVDFIHAEQTVTGRCADISAAGIRIRFPHALERNLCGRLILRYAGRAIDLQARVVYTGSESSGLEFVCETSEQSEAVSELIDAVAGSQPRGVVLTMDRRWRMEAGSRG